MSRYEIILFVHIAASIIWLGSSTRIERDGGMSPPALAGAKRLLLHARVDSVVLFLVVADMVLKPTADDVGALVVMGRCSPSRSSTSSPGIARSRFRLRRA